ncbi:unnamed protein product (macronuclear) [Paramecium tetraurelia]|uniref:Uncharacterized protein n=1 Tax=Paramecium tetraurelia TaxID=5888 RepID=A0DEU3_PARTE|nr:uncharacterized protein GSPATT00016386001 [Paramecium tetraurelia]CAK81560.1 unnamed protein product [Paramecium tetraurelia]|eukprot:XP_001448957.1 hypothetical protein (macronuclear) [Paramecium tetraurelia strain d4-2]
MKAATDMQAVLDTVGQEHPFWLQSRNRLSVQLNRSNQIHLKNQDPSLVQDIKYRYYEIVTIQQFGDIVLGYLKFYENNLQRMPFQLPEGDIGEWQDFNESETNYQAQSMIKMQMKKQYSLRKQWIEQQRKGSLIIANQQQARSAQSIYIPFNKTDGYCGSFDSPLSMSNPVNENLVNSKHSVQNSNGDSEQLPGGKRHTQNATKNRVSNIRKQSLDVSIDSLRESHISQQRNMSKAKSNLKTKQHELNIEHMEQSMVEKNRNCCGSECCQF